LIIINQYLIIGLSWKYHGNGDWKWIKSMDISSFLERKIHWIIMGNIMEIIIFYYPIDLRSY
jgi:hypothetical protein